MRHVQGAQQVDSNALIGADSQPNRPAWLGEAQKIQRDAGSQPRSGDPALRPSATFPKPFDCRAVQYKNQRKVRAGGAHLQFVERYKAMEADPRGCGLNPLHLFKNGEQITGDARLTGLKGPCGWYIRTHISLHRPPAGPAMRNQRLDNPAATSQAGDDRFFRLPARPDSSPRLRNRCDKKESPCHAIGSSLIRWAISGISGGTTWVGPFSSANTKMIIFQHC